MAKRSKDTSGNQIPMFLPESSWTPPDLSSLPSWKNAKRICLDAETKDVDLATLGPGTRRGAHTIGWGVGIENGPKFYLPIRHEGGDNLPVDQVLTYLRQNAKEFTGEIVGANLSYDLDYADLDGITFPQVSYFRDVQIADPLIDELQFSYSLESIGKRNDIEAKFEDDILEAGNIYGLGNTIKDIKKNLYKLPARFVGKYAERDISSPLEIYAKQRVSLDKDDLWQVFNLESKVLPVLVKMRQRGVRIDTERLEKIEAWALQQETDALQKVYDTTGFRIAVGDVWKANALAPALEQIGIRLGKTSQGKPQIDVDVLDSIDHHVASDIRWARKVNKMRTTFAASIRTYMVNGRIHCTFNQIAREDEKGDQKGGRYGRLSATDPNLQQQYNPEKEPELTKDWRKIFIPEEGAIWGTNDYSQQEPRWTTHFAALLGLEKADEAARRYREDPNTDNHTMMTRLIHGDAIVDAMSKKEFKTARGYAKNIFLGLCYGEGGAKLCRDIGLPTRWAVSIGQGRMRQVSYFEHKHDAYMHRAKVGDGYVFEAAGAEGQAIINGFDEAVPYVRKLAKFASDRAKKNGFVKDIVGRRLHFPLQDDGTYDWLHKALNRIIQGSSASQTKLALVELDAAGHYIQLQVHDETDGSFPSVMAAKNAGDIMRDCVLSVTTPLVPFKVDTECGLSWGEIGEIQ